MSAGLDQSPAEPCTRAFPTASSFQPVPKAAESMFVPHCTPRLVWEWFKWDKIPPQPLASLQPSCPAGRARGGPGVLGDDIWMIF